MAQLCERMGRWDRARDLWLQLARTRDAKKRADALLSLAFVMHDGFDDREAVGARARRGDGHRARRIPRSRETVEKRFAPAATGRASRPSAERVLARVRGGEAQVPLRMKAARAYRRSCTGPTWRRTIWPSRSGCRRTIRCRACKLAKLHVDNGRPDLALPEFRRALEIAPLHGEALRGIGGAFLRTGAADAGRFLDDVAAIGRRQRRRRRSRCRRSSSSGRSMPSEWATHFPRTATGPVRGDRRDRAPARAVRRRRCSSRPPGRFRAAICCPRPTRCRCACARSSTALGLEPMRVFVDAPKEREVRLCADAKLALAVGGALASTGAQGRLTFEVARLLAWTAAGRDHRRLLGDGRGARVPRRRRHRRRRRGHQGAAPPRHQAAAAQGPQGSRAHRRRGACATSARAATEWHAEEQRWADRVAFLLVARRDGGDRGAQRRQRPADDARARSSSCATWRPKAVGAPTHG